jgi:hypothetical protein
MAAAIDELDRAQVEHAEERSAAARQECEEAVQAPRPTHHLAYRRAARCHTDNMVQVVASRLDASFAALSDVTRRGVLEQLA